MTKQIINIGRSANDRSGDPLRTAFEKVNQNFTELYNTTGADNPADRLVNGTNEFILGTDGTVTFPDGLTAKDSIIGYNSSETVTTTDLAGTTSVTHTEQSQIELADNNITIARRTIDIRDDGVVIAIDELGSFLQVNSSGAIIKTYLDPEGPNNNVYYQVSTNSGASLEAVQENMGYNNFGSVTAVPGSVEIFASTNGITNGWTFDSEGTINLPSVFPRAFAAVLDTAHMTSPNPSVALSDIPWSMEVTFAIADGAIETQIEQIFPIQNNPGYVSGYTFTFTEADHGITGFEFSIELQDVVLPGGAGWTANIAVSQAPALPASIASQQTLKLHGNNSVVVSTGTGSHQEDFKFTGRRLQIPQSGDIVDYLGNSVLGGASDLSNYQSDLPVGINSTTAITILWNGLTGIEGSSSDLRLYANNHYLTVTNSGELQLDAGIRFADDTLQTTAFTGAYSASTPTDWNGVAPTTIAQAIDRLAAAVKALNTTGA